jgi:hypothetical protein
MLQPSLPEIRGQTPFRGLQEVARREVQFPEWLPPVLALRADPRGGVWVQQTLAVTGQQWVFLSVGVPQRRLHLPPGQSLLAIGEREIAALAKDSDGVESVHIYAHPFAHSASAAEHAAALDDGSRSAQSRRG